MTEPPKRYTDPASAREEEQRNDAPPGTDVYPCRKCGSPVQAGDRFCSQCGRKQGRSDQAFYRPGWIIILTLTVLGPLTLPLIWKSPYMSRPGKWAMSIFVILITALALGALVWVSWFVIQHLQETFKMSEMYGGY